MSIHINPGSGPVLDATEENATANMEAFAAGLRDLGVAITEVARHAEEDYGEGRYAYTVKTGDQRTLEVQMPGWPLDRVRFVDADHQDIWDFPRLYVDDSSWVWTFALTACLPGGPPLDDAVAVW
ncbi:hypothetical protein [Promicromonospora sp. NPDC023805]|uniref:hypothetical protein n=1 Tax=Promicromonospora sp. NPDC023805 TaxID=3154696 RepID=UPI0033E385A4